MTVTELQCMEKGCPPVETVIATPGATGPPRRCEVDEPMGGVGCEDDGASLVSGGARCEA